MGRFAGLLGACVLAGLLPLQGAAVQAAEQRDSALVERGRYLIKLGGCNDCHTAGFAESDAKTPERDWLEGEAVGFQGPWGTTYPTNLRLLIGGMTEAQWLDEVRTMHPKPPMPWWALRWMTRQDQRAVYVFVRALGPAGKPAPNDLPPGAAAATPVVAFPAPPPAK
jgi:mono/diheme cytochrome c family protein